MNCVPELPSAPTRGTTAQQQTQLCVADTGLFDDHVADLGQRASGTDKSHRFE